MTIYRNDKGTYSATPTPAPEGEVVQWEPIENEMEVASLLNSLVSEKAYGARQITDLSDRLNLRNRKLVEIEDYVKEAAKEGNDSIDISEFASEFGFSLEVSKEFTMTIEIQGTATFPIGQEPDLSDVDATVELGSYYSGDTWKTGKIPEFEVDDTYVYNYDWQ